MERERIFQTNECADVTYFEMPAIAASESPHPLKRWIRNSACEWSSAVRARRFAKLQQSADVVHFQQVLNAFGSRVVFNWLRRPATALRFVTVHELDGYQLEHRVANSIYNQADGLIVHSDEMKGRLVDLDVENARIHVLPYGTQIPALQLERERADLMFYGGHKPMVGKGIGTLFQAMSIVLRRLGTAAPRLKIHGHYGTRTPEEASRLAANYGIAGQIDWLNQISSDEMARRYENAIMCILPYTGSFAGLPAGVAAAHGLPVIATRKAGIPDHLGKNGVWIDEENPVQLADRIIALLQNEPLRRYLAMKLRRHAAQFLNWEIIAQNTLDLYKRSLSRSRAVLGACAPRSPTDPDVRE